MFIVYLLLGLFAGIIGGLFGLGGGLIMIPALVLLFGLSQHEAQGTTLAAMLPPVGLLAVITYYKAGYINLKISLWLALGLLVGSLIGAVFAKNVSEQNLSRIFGCILLVIALKMLIIGK